MSEELTAEVKSLLKDAAANSTVPAIPGLR